MTDSVHERKMYTDIKYNKTSHKKENYLFEIFREICPDVFINMYFTSQDPALNPNPNPDPDPNPASNPDPSPSHDLKNYLIHFIKIVKKKK